MCRCSHSPEEDIGFPGTGGTGTCELPGIDARSQTQVLQESQRVPNSWGKEEVDIYSCSSFL